MTVYESYFEVYKKISVLRFIAGGTSKIALLYTKKYVPIKIANTRITFPIFSDGILILSFLWPIEGPCYIL